MVCEEISSERSAVVPSPLSCPSGKEWGAIYFPSHPVGKTSMGLPGELTGCFSYLWL